MKKILSLVLSLVMVVSFAGCATEAQATWQEHYDLGVKYVNEAKYEEAILEFTKALEIDPKQAPVYIALAEVYVQQENYTAAQETLDKAITEIGEIDELNIAKGNITRKEKSGTTEKTELPNGWWCIGEYDEDGNFAKEIYYKEDGSVHHWIVNEYDEHGKCVKATSYNADGSIGLWWANEHNENGKCVKTICYSSDGAIFTIDEYFYENDLPVVTMRSSYEVDGKTLSTEITHTMKNIYNSVKINGSYSDNSGVYITDFVENCIDGSNIYFKCEDGVITISDP